MFHTALALVLLFFIPVTVRRFLESSCCGLPFLTAQHLFINSYVESHAENRPEGKRLNLRFVHHF